MKSRLVVGKILELLPCLSNKIICKLNCKTNFIYFKVNLRIADLESSLTTAELHRFVN